MDNLSRATVTIATEKPLYMNMAAALVRSYHYWNDDIPFVLITDRVSDVPEDVAQLDGVHVLRRPLQELGKGFSVKLYLDQLSPADETLFLDADCLVTGPIDPAFEQFREWSVTTVGALKDEGEWFGDLSDRCAHFEVPVVPVFVGCVYYFKKDETAETVFETARDLVDRYDELGYVRLRDLPNEEPLLSTGMALEGQEPIPDDGTLKADAMNFEEKIQVDVFEGVSRFEGDGSKQTSWGVTSARPIIAHFNDTYAEAPPYTREQEKLERVYVDGWSPTFASLYARFRHELPYRAVEVVKDAGRPVYRALFGTRDVKKNPRVLEQ
jgi:hypothetical protein